MHWRIQELPKGGHIRDYCKEKLFRHGRKPAAGENFILPPTLSYVAFGALSEEEMGFHQARTAKSPGTFKNFSRHVKIDPACGSPPCRVRFVAETSGGSIVTGRVSLHLAAKRPHLRLGGLGERLSSPSGSGRSPAAKRLW